ncbi:hypothetical protein AMJ80_09425 [bacterium SM23_31]|nr:MAG: hypothetical protein AMJ80_09425 [bacterium SM23_31]
MTTANQEKNKAIEFRETIGEVHLAGFNLVRLSRLKYKENPHTFVEVRIFQRGYDDEGAEAYYPIKKIKNDKSRKKFE